MTISLPFTGAQAYPPPFAVWIAAGQDPHSFDRARAEKDHRGYDCNDYAYDAVQALIAEDRDPYYVDCTTENGEPHMIAAYKTHDGVVYARDCRAPSDLPLAELVAKGYTLVSAADRKAGLWYAP